MLGLYPNRHVDEGRRAPKNRGVLARILSATGIVKARTAPLAVVGELALDGQIQPVRGVLAAALTCRRERVGTLLVPVANRAEAAAVSGLDVLAASTLRQAVALLNGEAASETEKPVERSEEHTS